MTPKERAHLAIKDPLEEYMKPLDAENLASFLMSLDVSPHDIANALECAFEWARVNDPATPEQAKRFVEGL